MKTNLRYEFAFILVVLTYGQLAFAMTNLFGPEEVLTFRFKAPFAKILKEARAIGADGESEFLQYDATVSYPDASGNETELAVRVRARGNTSLEDCDFAKLEIEFARDEKFRASVFAENAKIKIGTHCGIRLKNSDTRG